MESISFQYPAWYLILCFLLGLGFAVALYLRDKTFHEQSARLNWVLGLIRFLAVSFMAILLLAPLLKSLITETKKPVVVIAQDDSESIKASMDSVARMAYEEELRGLEEQLSEDFEVQSYSFGDAIKEGFSFQYADKVSNISEMLNEVYDLYSNQNLGAVVMATDGIYNEGSNPVYSGSNLNAPVYTIALGDTIPKKDLVLKRVFHNKVAYLGDKFSVQVDIGAVNCTGSNPQLVVSKVEGGRLRTLQQISIPVNTNDFFTTREILLDADVAGVQRYRLRLTNLQEEASTVNNQRDFFVDVLDARQKILILAHSPHPDITAIKQSILSNQNYEVTVAYAKKLNVDVRQFDFVILHQLPGKGINISGTINQLDQRKTPRLFIVGSRTELNRFNNAQNLLTIRGDDRNTNDVEPILDPGFSVFTIDEQLKNELPNFVPLTAPFGEFDPSPNANVFLKQRISRIDTRYPLLVMGESRDTKVGVLAAEGIWKWRLFDFLQHQNHELFDELLGKTVQYLSLKEDKRRFRVTPTKNIFNENEPILFDAELYNESFELINDQDVSMTITNEEGRNFDYVFNKSGNAYTLDAGSFVAGNYNYKATVMSNGQALNFTGQFNVQPVQLELYATTANHGLLRLLSDEYGGQLLYPGQITGFGEQIRNNDRAKPVIYQTSRTRSVINIKWIFLVLAGLLTLEWFLRRYFGGY
jgi:hypothetical protein